MRASAMGVGLYKEMAMDMAKMNLESGLAMKGQKIRGKVSYHCTGPMNAECRARARAC
jgi:hypothetical protein